ncbi:MAG TPA: cell wall-binding repeat-containing protein [Candidatus Limnocylindria bacterium]|nr:cell wall-binding repeat-containing protein [Candidatus Limnocylindria bacterium]
MHTKIVSRALLLASLVVAWTSVAPVQTPIGSIGVSPARAADVAVTRITGGTDRYGVAAAISRAHFAPGVPAVFVATGQNFPDALAGGPIAARMGVPILLVRSGDIPAPTADELRRLAPNRIIILGGTASVSGTVAANLGAYQTGGGVQRISAADRYGLAAAVSQAYVPAGVAVVYVATGENFPDALSGGVGAGRAGTSILLVRGGGIPSSTATELRRLRPGRIVVLGGPGSVSDGVVSALRAYATSGQVTRIGGRDRYDVAVGVSRSAYPNGAAALYVANGQNYPDALTAVPAAARAGASLLLVPSDRLPTAVRDEARRLLPTRLAIVGGPVSVRDRVTFDLRVALGDLPPLPACRYTDVLTKFRAYGDWHRTLLDTIYMIGRDYHPGDMVDTSSAGLNGGYPVRSHIAADLKALAAAARAAGRPIQVASGFRSWDQQKATFDYWVSVGGYEQALRTSARAGHSEHQLGTTLDFTTQGGLPPWEYADWATTPAGAWMAANAHKYGFVMSYPKGRFSTVCYDYEPWHYRYLGRDRARAVVQSGLTLREWLWMVGDGA